MEQAKTSNTNNSTGFQIIKSSITYSMSGLVASFGLRGFQFVYNVLLRMRRPSVTQKQIGTDLAMCNHCNTDAQRCNAQRAINQHHALMKLIYLAYISFYPATSNRMPNLLPCAIELSSSSSDLQSSLASPRQDLEQEVVGDTVGK